MSYPVADTESNDISPAQSGPGTVVDVKKFIFKLIGFLPWIIISILVAYSIANLYLRYTASIHKASAQVLIKDDQAASSDYNIIRDLGVMPGAKEIQDQIDILQSYELAKTVVDSLHLQFQIVAQGRISSSAIYGDAIPIFINTMPYDTVDFKPITYKLQATQQNFTLQVPGLKAISYNYGDTFLLDNHSVYVLPNKTVKFNEKGYELKIFDTRTVANNIKRLVYVKKLHEMGGILEIAMNDEVPQKAIDILNVLIESFTRVSKLDKSQAAFSTNKFLNERVAEVERKLTGIEVVADSFKRANKIVDVTTAGQQYLGDVKEFDKTRLEQEESLHLLDQLSDYLKNAKSVTEIIPSNNGIGDQTLTELISQHNQAVILYNSQALKSVEKDPIVNRMAAGIITLRQSIIKNIQSIKMGYQTKLQQTVTQYNISNNLLASMPEKERILVNLNRQIQVQEQLYNFLLQKQADAQLSLAVITGDSRVIEYAHDDGIISPKGSQIKMFSILIGVILPIVVMILLDFFNNRISDKREVEEGTRVPLIGELSYNAKQKNIMVTPQSRGVLAEQFRLIRTNLQYIAADKKGKTILVTSFMSGEGKSFVSLNLAGSLATGDKKVLLLELDLRKPKLAKYLNIEAGVGLTDYLVKNDLRFEEVITNVQGAANVDIITSGPIPPNPTELIMSEKFNNLLKAAKEKYDFIVIDSSPIGLVADAFIIGHAVDITLFIIRHKYSYKTTINFIEKLYVEKKFVRLGIVMNGIIASSGLGYGYGYGYGYSYGYGYHYGSGYYTEEQSKGLKGFLNRIFKK